MTIEFDIPITPTAMQRPRAAARGGFARVYKSAKQAANERTIETFLMPYKPKEPIKGAISVEIATFFPVAQSWSKTRKKQAIEGQIRHTGKPDVDNLAKNLFDCLTRMAFWEDDKQVVRLLTTKAYTAESVGSWRVKIEETGAGA